MQAKTANMFNKLPNNGLLPENSETETCISIPEPSPSPTNLDKSQNESVSTRPIEKDKNLIEILTHSQIYQDFCFAFNEAFSLPLVLRPVELWRLPLHKKKNENRFCALIAKKSSTCSLCLQVQKKLVDEAVESPKTIKCPFGLCDSAVPVKIGERVIGYIQTGQIFLKTPTEKQFETVLKILENSGYAVDVKELRRIYFSTPVINQSKFNSIITILNIFGKQLTLMSNQLAMMQKSTEPSIIKRAKEFIAQHHTEDFTLADVAKYVNSSPYYFCKIFKKYTGINFTDYVSRIRVERAKNLLMNPNIRICEIAFEVGFQSLTHFNRVFKRTTGLSPTEYRSRLPLI
ncbi:MAG: helix-turn-helix domain-containing protein [Verrucomicrobiia bacterium]